MDARCREVGRNRRGFTLIELLTSIAIMGLLMALLAPGLQSAREQAKRVVCKNNLRNVNTALGMYLHEFDAYPILVDVERRGWATWTYGGWMGNDFKTYCTPKGTGAHCSQAWERPLSVYMRGPQSIPRDDPGSDGLFGTNDDRVTEMPVFRCPSDRFSNQWRYRAGSSKTPTYSTWERSSYEQVGTSYHMNFFWWFQAVARTSSELRAEGEWREVWKQAQGIGMDMWRRKYSEGGASRFVSLVEEPFDWGIGQRIPLSADATMEPDDLHSACSMQTMGFHGQWSRHVMAFLDGHVDYLFADTRHQRGPDWTVTNEDWADTMTRDNCPGNESAR